MKRLLILTAILLLPLGAGAQTAMEWGTRVSAEANYKIAKGVHLYAEEELRTSNATFDNVRTTLGFTYKPVKAVKMGVGYTLINARKQSTGEFKAPRHRLFADLSGTLRAGYLQFTLKERFQVTHRTGSFNAYENTPNAMALKSRLTVKYTYWRVTEPYLSFEVRTALNDPWGSVTGPAKWNSKGTKAYYDYTHMGYTHVYNNRYRGELGVNFELDKSHALKPYVLLDYCTDYDLDINAEGNHLMSAAYTDVLCLSVGLNYVFSF